MKIAIIQISEAGNEIASTLQRELKAKVIQRSEVGEEWQKQDAFIHHLLTTNTKIPLWCVWIVWD